MKVLLLLVTLTFFAALSLSLPTQLNRDPELISGHTEGDMIIQKFGRNSVKNLWQRWPNCTIRYHIHCKEYGNDHLLTIKQNFADITSICGLQFEEVVKPIQPLLNITCEPDGCFAAVGFIPQGTRINLQNHPVGVGCFRYGTVGHEISHALGRYHEHTRPDRDAYIRVMWDNISPNTKWNFMKKSAKDADMHGLAYDYESNMHYGAYGFSKNGLATIETLRKAKAQIGQRLGFSKLDKAKLRKLYPGCKK